MEDEKKEAHQVLDMARAGLDVPGSTVWWALCVLGDAL